MGWWNAYRNVESDDARADKLGGSVNDSNVFCVFRGLRRQRGNVHGQYHKEFLAIQFDSHVSQLTYSKLNVLALGVHTNLQLELLDDGSVDIEPLGLQSRKTIRGDRDLS